MSMTMTAGRRRIHDRLAAQPGVRSVRRPILADGPDEFDLFYVRAGEESEHPLVILPGGPGAASIALYRGLRKRAVADGRDVIMVEHRGVGMSRHDDDGADLPLDALTIEAVVDDLAAVLDDAGVASAVLYGASYGTYLAAGVGVRHPDRVHAMVLDSPLLSADDIDVMRDAVRRVLWDGVPETAEIAVKVRQLVEKGVLTPARRGSPRTCTGSADPTCSVASSTCCSRAAIGSGARSVSARGCCPNARRRSTTNPTWSAASATANSTMARCPTASRSTRPWRTARRPPVKSTSSPSPTI